MANLSKMAASVDLVEEGKWFTYHEDFEILIASTKCQAFRKALEKLGTSTRKGFRSASLSEGLDSAQRDRLAVIHLVKGWRGLTEPGPAGDNGQEPPEVEVPFSTEKALELFFDPQYPGFMEFLWICAGDLGEFVEGEARARGKD